MSVAAVLLVSVAASLAEVMTDLAKRFEAQTGVQVQVNAAASNTLARQIVAGAPVDVFISADEAQMDVVGKSGRLVANSRVSLLSNQLVVVVPMRNPPVSITNARDLADPRLQRIAMGHPEAVPAGVYGRQWLEKAGVWQHVQRKVVPLSTVRAALAAVREGRAHAGIVYVTDARTEAGVVVAYRVPLDEAPRISYPAAVIAGKHQADAAKFLAFLQSSEARAAFVAAGFGVH